VLGDAVLLGGAGVAGVVDDVDEGRVVVLIGDGALAEALGDAGGVVHRLKGQAHGHPDPLAHDGPLQEDGLPVLGLLAGNDGVGDLLHSLVVAVVGQTGYLGKDLFPDAGDGRRYAAH